MTALAANRPIPQIGPDAVGLRKARFPLALSMPAATVYGPGGVTLPTVALTGAENPSSLVGGFAGFYPVQVQIPTGGALGTATFSWTLNGVQQAANVTTAASVALGSTGLTATFAAGTYIAGTSYTFVPNYTHLWAGAIVCVNAAGQLVDGTSSTSLTCVGVNAVECTNSPLLIPQLQPRLAAEVYVGGTFPFASGSGGDLLAAANIGADVYLIDDQTVGLTNGGNTRQRVGWLSDYRTFPDPRGDSPSWAALFPAVVTMTANPSAL